MGARAVHAAAPATKSNRSGIGAVVRVETDSGAQWRTVHSGSSYCSQSDLAVTFGLGAGGPGFPGPAKVQTARRVAGASGR